MNTPSFKLCLYVDPKTACQAAAEHLAHVLHARQQGTPKPYAAGSEGPRGRHRILESGHV